MVAIQKKQRTQYSYTVFQTSMGWVGALASQKGLRRLNLPVPTQQQAIDELDLDAVDATFAPEAFTGLATQVQRLIEGKTHRIDMPLDLEGTAPFFQKVWKACLSIPAGETRSYAWLAAQAGNPLAVRAAGQAMARNPIALVIPCHRVVGSSGSLTGYGGGLDMKSRLLAAESRA